MNLKLGLPVRELAISHNYYSEQYMRNRLEGKPIRHAPVAVPRPDMRPRVDWRTGERMDEAAMRERFDADLPAGGSQ